MKMKKMLLGAFLGIFTLAGIAILPNYASATGSNNDEYETLFENKWISTDNKLTGQTTAWDTGVKVVKRTINMCLWLLSTIAVVICMYGWFLMVTAAGDEKKYQKGLSVLKYAAIWLAIIALSWIIVGVIFRFIGAAANDNNATMISK